MTHVPARQPTTICAAIAMAASLIATDAATAGDGHRRERAATPQLAAYAEECGACHLPYPPALLPPESWQRLMSNLPRHFGTDASLAPPMRAALDSWLQWHAGRSQRPRRDAAAPPEDRITRSTWFRREHREVPAATWSHADVASPSRCDACHAGATQGDFDEHAVRLPR